MANFSPKERLMPNVANIDWTAQQETARERSLAGGGKPGLVQAERLADKTGREILEAMMSGDLP
jgi:hypothetical protein